jgi:hypothetical protein
VSRVRIHRIEPWEATLPAAVRRERASGWSVADRTGAAGALDLGSRIAFAADLQAKAGNAAMGHVLGRVRTDHKADPPGGLADIMAKSGPGNRGLTRTSYTANPPLFRGGQTESTGGVVSIRPAPVRLPKLDQDVFWPAPGLHKIRAMGKGSQFLDVSVDWSNKLGEGETEHVTDNDAAYAMTWGKVASVLNKMAEERFTGASIDDATKAAWQAFKNRLPQALRPDGDSPTPEAQEKKWGADDKNTIFRKLMNESKRARDNSGWHTPDQVLKENRGDDEIDELAVGNSKIGAKKTEVLMQEAWDRVTKT